MHFGTTTTLTFINTETVQMIGVRCIFCFYVSCLYTHNKTNNNKKKGDFAYKDRMLTSGNTSTAVQMSDTQNTLNMSQDDRLLFNLNVLSSLKKHDRLKCHQNLISIDDRWPFQGIYRWWSGDSKDMVTRFMFDMMSELVLRIKTLTIQPRSVDEDRVIKKFATILPQARKGVMNLKFYTYDDNLTKTKFGLILDKIDDILFELSQFDNKIDNKQCDFV